MESIKAVVEQIIFSNPDNGYAVLQVNTGDDWQTIVGTFPEIAIGTTLQCIGEWKNDKKYGRQFIVETWHEEVPSTIVGMEKYLGSGLINGIGPKMAHTIVKFFGAETMNVIENDIERLLQVPGIGKGRFNKIHTSWEKQKGVKDIMVFLQGNGVSAAYAAKIYKVYGKDSIKKVKENPYCLADDVFGIGFKMADAIASKMGYGKNDPRRCQAGIIYTLNQLANEGHCYAERIHLLKAAVELLQAELQPITDALDALLLEQNVILDECAVFLPLYYYAEVGVANKLKRLLKDKSGGEFASRLNMKEISDKSKIDYDDVQVAAINEALKSKVMVLTGGPGTGKTTTTLGIIAALEAQKKEIVCAAPTGRAAKRMREATGKEAKTIHRLLEFNPKGGFGRNEETPLIGDVLIVDESSMIDILLMNALLKAVPDNMRLILVGDIDQLPSVGAGNVLRDIIDSEAVPVVRLTRIFRQAMTSRIVTNAHKVNRGEFPDVSNDMDGDFFFIKEDDPEHAAAEIVNIVKNRIPKAYGYGIGDIQVLVPMRKSVVGSVSLNAALQEAINPVGDCLQSGAFKYRKDDKVMQIRNNYDKGVFNGDIGTVENVDTDENTLTVRFDTELVEYEKSELGELTLSYACTIHKSQGSEYPVVVMPLMMPHFIMLQRNLVYTGITRAKKLCIVIGTPKALAMAVKNQTVTKRNTRLKERLNEK